MLDQNAKLKGVRKLAKYTKADAAKDTGVSIKEASAAHHIAKDDAFGKGSRDSKSGGDRTTEKDAAAAHEIGEDHGLFGGGESDKAGSGESDKAGDGKSSDGSSDADSGSDESGDGSSGADSGSDK